MTAIAVEGSSVDTGHGCDSSTTLDTPDQSRVFVAGKLVACKGDPTIPHLINVGDICVTHIASISESSTNVFIGGNGVARVNDACDSGEITTGINTVIVN